MTTKVIEKSVDFSNTATAFGYKSDSELYRALFLFKSIQYPLLVKIGPLAVNFALNVGLPIKGLLKEFFFNQFCGGVTLADTIPVSEKLFQYGVSTVLDYSVEAQKSEKGYNTCQAEVLNCIAHAAQRKEVSFVALKITGLGNFDLLAKKQANQPMTAAENQQFEALVERLDTICQAAEKSGQSVFIDAEESWIQEVIDSLSEAMMIRYNQQRPIVYTTVQMYRHDRLAYLNKLDTLTKEKKFIAGVKLVRGAYLEKENKRAHQLNYPTPMQRSKQQTDNDYNKAALFMLDRLDQFAICAGTHNEESCRQIVNFVNQHHLPNNHPHIFFSQLYGMSDNLSFNLAAAGFNTGKYLPYGPLEAVLPYLFRRAQENTSIAGQTGRELQLIQKEINRRRRSKKSF
jgi:proline dehydrogenase